MKRSYALFLLAGSMTPWAFTQTLPGPVSGSGSTGNTGRVGTGTNGSLGQPSTTGFPSTGTPNNSPSGSPGVPIFLSGKVVMADGSPVPGGLSIKRTCGVATRTVTYTDSKGHFSFQWGDYEGVVPDASDDGGGFGRTAASSRGIGGDTNGGMNSLQNCELKVDAPGFQSDVVRLDDHKRLDDPDVGTIVLRRLANVEGTSVSVTSLAAPPDAKKAYEKGLQSAAKGKSADAQKSFEKAVAVYPKYANAWLDLGRERLKAGMEAPAREAFLKALEADDKLVGADAELGMMAARAKNWKEAAQYLDATMRLDPIDFARLRFPAAVAEYNVQNFEGSERNVREALKSDPGHPDPQQDQLLGVLLLRKGDLAGGVEELRTYLRLAPAAPDADKVKSEIAQAESINARAAGTGSGTTAPAH